MGYPSTIKLLSVYLSIDLRKKKNDQQTNSLKTTIHTNVKRFSELKKTSEKKRNKEFIVIYGNFFGLFYDYSFFFRSKFHSVITGFFPRVIKPSNNEANCPESNYKKLSINIPLCQVTCKHV